MTLRLIGTYKIASSVGQALQRALEDVNRSLDSVSGKISAMYADVIVRTVGAGVWIITIVDEKASNCTKRVLGINARGFGEESAFNNAMLRLSDQLRKLGGGEIVDTYTQIKLSPLPGLVYCTIIVAVNVGCSE